MFGLVWDWEVSATDENGVEIYSIQGTERTRRASTRAAEFARQVIAAQMLANGDTDIEVVYE